jgi:hypothetical protein
LFSKLFKNFSALKKEDGAQSAPSSFLGFDLVYTMFEA